MKRFAVSGVVIQPLSGIRQKKAEFHGNSACLVIHTNMQMVIDSAIAFSSSNFRHAS